MLERPKLNVRVRDKLHVKVEHTHRAKVCVYVCQISFSIVFSVHCISQLCWVLGPCETKLVVALLFSLSSRRLWWRKIPSVGRYINQQIRSKQNSLPDSKKKGTINEYISEGWHKVTCMISSHLRFIPFFTSLFILYTSPSSSLSLSLLPYLSLPLSWDPAKYSYVNLNLFCRCFFHLAGNKKQSSTYVVVVFHPFC